MRAALVHHQFFPRPTQHSANGIRRRWLSHQRCSRPPYKVLPHPGRSTPTFYWDPVNCSIARAKRCSPPPRWDDFGAAHMGWSREKSFLCYHCHPVHRDGLHPHHGVSVLRRLETPPFQMPSSMRYNRFPTGSNQLRVPAKLGTFRWKSHRLGNTERPPSRASCPWIGKNNYCSRHVVTKFQLCSPFHRRLSTSWDFQVHPHCIWRAPTRVSATRLTDQSKWRCRVARGTLATLRSSKCSVEWHELLPDRRRFGLHRLHARDVQYSYSSLWCPSSRDIAKRVLQSGTDDSIWPQSAVSWTICSLFCSTLWPAQRRCDRSLFGQ